MVDILTIQLTNFIFIFFGSFGIIGLTLSQFETKVPLKLVQGIRDGAEGGGDVDSVASLRNCT